MIGRLMKDNQMADRVIAKLDLNTVIKKLPIAIFVISADRRILLSNRLARQYHCQDRMENKGKRVGNVIGCANAEAHVAGCGFSEVCHLCKVKAIVDQTFARKQSTARYETSINTRAMGIRSLRMSLTYICTDESLASEQEICLVTIEDITEVKKKERMAAASETIGAICHEMSQPLQAIMGNVELLAQFQLGDSATLRIEKIYNEMGRIKSIVNKLMNMTQYQTKPYLGTYILDVERSAGKC